ncbi:MAG: hypothetical protein ACJ73S_18545 [Mycobacteriales bacterium]
MPEPPPPSPPTPPWWRAIRWGRLLRIGYAVVAVLATVTLVLSNIRLYTVDTSAYGDPRRVPPDAVSQLDWLRSRLDGGAATEAVRATPAGYVLLYALYGASWVQVGERETGRLRARAAREVGWALAQLDSPLGRAPFEGRMDPTLGVFYLGWSAWLRGGLLRLRPAPDPAEARRFDADCATLAAAFARSPSPYLPSLPDQVWPADSVVAMAALRLHDRVRGQSRYAGLARRWVTSVERHLDVATGLLPHRTDTAGAALEPPRGSSQVVVQRFLPEIDPVFARRQYSRFRDTFVRLVAGVPAVREYPKGTRGHGDADSGPMLFGATLTGTMAAIGPALEHRDRDLADATLAAVEGAAMPLTFGDSKRYALGLRPLADAWLVWGKTALPLPDRRPDHPGHFPRLVPFWWRVPWHLLSLLALMVVLFPAYWGLRRWRQARYAGEAGGEDFDDYGEEDDEE